MYAIVKILPVNYIIKKGNLSKFSIANNLHYMESNFSTNAIVIAKCVNDIVNLPLIQCMYTVYTP